MIKKFREMLELQDNFNEQTIEDWRSHNLDWVQALTIESAEQADSLGWKWWKFGEDNMNNFKVEVIDNWHFLMSLGLEKYTEHYLATAFVNIWNDSFKDDTEIDLQHSTQFFCFCVLATKFDKNPSDEFFIKSVYTLFLIMQELQMDVENLYADYITKNVLNKFRQDNGYKEGSYLKIWNEKEDNVVAYELVDTADTFESLYIKFVNYYKNIKGE